MMTTIAPPSTPAFPLLRWLFIALVWLYVVSVVLQLFSIGMVLMVGQGAWLAYHRTIGHSVGVIALALPIVALIGRMPRRILLASVGLLILYILQFFFAKAAAGSMLRALHVVNALAIFWAATTTAQWARQQR